MPPAERGGGHDGASQSRAGDRRLDHLVDDTECLGLLDATGDQLVLGETRPIDIPVAHDPDVAGAAPETDPTPGGLAMTEDPGPRSSPYDPASADDLASLARALETRPPRGFDRVGSGRHAMDKGRNLHEAEEEKFLKRVADRVGEGEKRKAFDHLVIAAPPRALGLLRSLLPPAAQQRIRAETAKDLLDEDAPKLRERLRGLLRG